MFIVLPGAVADGAFYWQSLRPMWHAACSKASTLSSLQVKKAETMGTIQQRFEVEQPAQAVYEALAEPGDVLRTLPGVALVTRDSDDHYRVTVTTAEGTRETSVHLVRHAELRRVEWRTVDGEWTGALTVE